MNKNKTVTLEFNMKEAERLYNAKGSSFYLQQQDRFIVDEEDEELLKSIVTDSIAYENDNVSMVWCETFLNLKILRDCYRANGIRCVEICDEACYEKDDGTWEFSDYCLVVDEPSGLNTGRLGDDGKVVEGYNSKK